MVPSLAPRHRVRSRHGIAADEGDGMSAISVVVRVAEVIALVWAAISALSVLFVWLWMRERYGRGGPFPAKDATLPAPTATG